MIPIAFICQGQVLCAVYASGYLLWCSVISIFHCFFFFSIDHIFISIWSYLFDFYFDHSVIATLLTVQCASFAVCWWWDQATLLHCIVYQAPLFLQYIATLSYNVWSPSFVSQDILRPPVSLYTCGQVDLLFGNILGDITCSLRSHCLLPPSTRTVTLWASSLTAYLSLHQGSTLSLSLYAWGRSIVNNLPGFIGISSQRVKWPWQSASWKIRKPAAPVELNIKPQQLGSWSALPVPYNNRWTRASFWAFRQKDQQGPQKSNTGFVQTLSVTLHTPSWWFHYVAIILKQNKWPPLRDGRRGQKNYSRNLWRNNIFHYK